MSAHFGAPAGSRHSAGGGIIAVRLARIRFTVLQPVQTTNLKTEPLWWEDAPPQDLGSGPFPEESDVAIIGSGYTGLSAALELSRAGTRVVVLDSDRIGYGASTRNGGQFLPEPKFAPRDKLVRRLGEALADRVLEDGRAASRSMMEVIDREGIECNMIQPGRFVGAHCPAAFRALEDKLRQYEAQGIEVERGQHPHQGDDDAGSDGRRLPVDLELVDGRRRDHLQEGHRRRDGPDGQGEEEGDSHHPPDGPGPTGDPCAG